MANETREIVTLVLRLIREDKGATKEIKQEFKNLQTAITQLQKSDTLDLEKFFKGKETPKELAKAFQDARAHLERTRDALQKVGVDSGRNFNNINRAIEGFGQVTEENALKALQALGRVAEQQKKTADSAKASAKASADAAVKSNKKFVDSIPVIAEEMGRLTAEFGKSKTELPKSLAPLEDRLANLRRLTEDVTVAGQRLRSLRSTLGFSPEQVENIKGMQDQLFKLRDSVRDQLSATERSIKSVRDQAEANEAAKETLSTLSNEFNRVEKTIKSVSEADLQATAKSKELIGTYTDKFNTIRRLERALNDLVAAESKLGAQVSPDVRKQYEERVQEARNLLDTEKANLALIKRQKDEYVKAENAIKVQDSALGRVQDRFQALQTQLQTAARLTAEEMAKIKPDPSLISKYASTVRSTLTEITGEVLNVNKALGGLEKPSEVAFAGIRSSVEKTRGTANDLLKNLESLRKEASELTREATGTTAEARLRGVLAKNFKDLQKAQHSAFTDLRRNLKEAQESTQGWTLSAEQGVRKYLKELTKTRDKLEDLKRQASSVGDVTTMGRAEATLRRLRSVIAGSQKRLEDLVNTGATFKSKETITKSFSDARKTLDSLGQQFRYHAKAFKQSDFSEGLRTLGKEHVRTIRDTLGNLQHQYQVAIRSISRDLIALDKVPGAEKLVQGFKELNLSANQASIRLSDYISTLKLVEKETTQLSELGRRFGINFAGSYKQMAEGGSLIHRTVGGLFKFLSDGHDATINKTGAHTAALHQLENELVRFRSGVAEWSISLLALGTLVTAPFAAAITSFLEFSDVMGIVRAVSNATADQFKDLQAAATEMGATTRFTAEQAAQGLRFLAMAGFTATQAVGALPTTLNLAQAAAIGLGDAADIVTNIMTGFEMQVEDLPRAADVLTKAFTTSNSTLSELGFAFKYVGAIGKGLGADFNDLVGSLALLHNAGFKGTMAGTALRGALDSMFNPTKQEAEVMKQLGERIGLAGFQIEDATGKFVGFTRIIEQLEEAGFSSGEALALFGQRAGPGMAALLRMGSRQLQDYREQLDAAEGTTDRISKQMEETLKGRFLLAFSAIAALGEQIAHNLEPVLGALADSVATIVNKIIQLREALGPVTKLFDVAVASTAALIAVLGAATFAWFLLLVPAAQFITFMHTITAVVASGTVAITKNATAATANAVAQEGLTGAYFRQVLGIKAAEAATVGLTTAQAAAAAEAIKAGKMDIVGIFKPEPGDLLKVRNAGVETAADFNNAMRDQLAEMAPAFIGLGDRLKGIFSGVAVTVGAISRKLVDDLRGTIAQSVAAATGASQGVVSAAEAAAGAASVAAGSGIRGLFFKLASAIGVAAKATWGLVLALTAVGVAGLGAVGKLLGLLAGGKFAQAGLMLAHGFKVAFGVLRGLAAFLVAHPVIAVVTGLVTLFWLMPKPVAVTNAELEKTKGLLKSVGSEAESNINKITKGQESIIGLVSEAEQLGQAIPFDAIAKEQTKVLDGTDRLVKIITEYGEKVADIKLDIGETGEINAISVALKDGSAKAEIYNADLYKLNLTQQQLADRSSRLNRVLVAINGQLKERAFEASAQQAILLGNEVTTLRSEFNRLSTSTSFLSNNITTPFATQQERAARSIQIQGDLNKKIAETASTLGLIGQSEEEIQKTVERTKEKFEAQYGAIDRLVDLVKSGLTRSWHDSRKEMEWMLNEAARFATKAVPELVKFKPDAAIARWQRSMLSLKDVIAETVDHLDKIQKESGGVLKELFEFDTEEAARYFEFVGDGYQREVDELERLSKERVRTLSNTTNHVKSLAVLEAEEVIRLENDKLAAAEKMHNAKLDRLKAFVDKQRAILEAAGRSTFELDQAEYETKKDFISDRLRIVSAALDAEREAHRKLAEDIKKLEEGKKEAIQKLADIRESLADKSLDEEEVYAKKSAKLADLIAQARITALSGQFARSKELSDKATALAEELASDTEATEKAKIATLDEATRSLGNIYDIVYRGMERSAKEAQGGITDSTKALEQQFGNLVTALKSLEEVMARAAGIKAIEEGFASQDKQIEKTISLYDAYATKIKETTGQVAKVRQVPVDLGGGAKAVTPEITPLGKDLRLIERYEAELLTIEKVQGEIAATGLITPEQHQQLMGAIGNINNLKDQIQALVGIDPLAGIDWQGFYQKVQGGTQFSVEAVTNQVGGVIGNYKKMVGTYVAGSETLQHHQKENAREAANLGDKVTQSIEKSADANRKLEKARGIQVQIDAQAKLAERSEAAMHANDSLVKVIKGLTGLDINLEKIMEGDPEVVKTAANNMLSLRTELIALVDKLPELQAMDLMDEDAANRTRRLLELLDEDWGGYIDSVGEGANVSEDAANVLRTKLGEALGLARNHTDDLIRTSEKLKKTGFEIGTKGILETETKLKDMLDVLNDIRTGLDLGDVDIDIGGAAAQLEALEKDFVRLKALMEEPIKTAVVKPSQAGGVISGLVNGGMARIQRFANGSQVFRRPAYSTVPGVGSGDKVPALLEPGEFIIRKSSVKRFGVDFLNMINQGVLRMSSAGGMIANAPDRLANLLTSLTPTPYYQTAIAGYAGGGVVSNTGSGSRDVVDVNLNVGTTKATLTGERQEVRKLVNSLKVLSGG